MENKYILVALLAVAASIFAISVASAHGTNDYNGMVGMMQGINGNSFVHDQDDIDWMKDEMKEHMNLTDKEINEMTEHCPMMRGR